MRKLFLVWIMCANITVLVTAQAPGDEDKLCTVTLPSIGQNVITYSPNIKPLMDSFHYDDLLPPRSFESTPTTWQQVDIDGIENIAFITSWTEQGRESCRSTVTVCGFGVGSQNNWLITQFISRTVNGVRLPQVVVLLESQLTGCPTDGACQRTFVLNKYETSSVNKAAAIETDRYQFVNTLTTRESQVTVTLTENVKFDSDNSGFYLGVQDEGTCILISRLLVYYHVCPGEISNLVMRPETIAPSIGSSMPLKVTANCTANARPRDGESVKLICLERGVWYQQTGTGCDCEDGYIESSDGRDCVLCGPGTYGKASAGVCEVCPANSNSTVQGSAVCPCLEGFYRLPTQIDQPCTPCEPGRYEKLSEGVCEVCPANSNSTVQGSAVCPCLEGFYRLPTEVDLPCTQPPSAPINLTVLDVNDTTITLSWREPVFRGGRDELFYSLWYLSSDQLERILFGTVETTMGVITGLRAGDTYQVFVTAENNITQLIPVNLIMERTLATITTTKRSLDDGSSGSAGVIAGAAAAFGVTVIVILVIYILLSIFFLVRQKEVPEKKFSENIYSNGQPKTLPRLTPMNLDQGNVQSNDTVPQGCLEADYDQVATTSD